MIYEEIILIFYLQFANVHCKKKLNIIAKGKQARKESLNNMKISIDNSYIYNNYTPKSKLLKASDSIL